MKSPQATGSVALEINITSSDIEAMLDAYDSGMCDLSTANCLSRAVGKRLNATRPVRLIRHRALGGHLLIGETRVPVPDSILSWLEQAEIGARCNPVRFQLEVPRKLLTPSTSGEILLPLPVSF